MNLVALKCPHCARELPSAPERRIFVCDECARSWRVDSVAEKLELVPRYILSPALPLPSDGRIVLLPFWRLAAPEAAVRSSENRLPSEMRIPAIGLQRSSLLLKWAEQLSRVRDPLGESITWRKLGNTSGPAPEPAEIAAEDAYDLAELLALQMVKGWPPEEELESWEIPFSSPELVDWPCVHRHGEIVDLIFGRAQSETLIGNRILADQRYRIHSLESVGT